MRYRVESPRLCHAYSSVTLCIVGRSGVGKTAFMAKLAQVVTDKEHQEQHQNEAKSHVFKGQPPTPQRHTSKQQQRSQHQSHPSKERPHRTRTKNHRSQNNINSTDAINLLLPRGPSPGPLSDLLSPPAPIAALRPVLFRFCGTSPCISDDGLSLVRGLCYQIIWLFSEEHLASQQHTTTSTTSDDGDPVPSQESAKVFVGGPRLLPTVVHPTVPMASVIPSTYMEAVQLLHALLARHAVILFLDGLEALSDVHGARSTVSFLRDLHPHPGRAHAPTRGIVLSITFTFLTNIDASYPL